MRTETSVREKLDELSEARRLAVENEEDEELESLNLTIWALEWVLGESEILNANY